jgi:hypothetical protein
VSKTGFYAAVYNNGGNQKAGVLEDTSISEKEARERAGRLWEANRASAADSARIPSHWRQSLKDLAGNPTRLEKGGPVRLGRREAGCETSSQGGR